MVSTRSNRSDADGANAVSNSRAEVGSTPLPSRRGPGLPKCTKQGVGTASTSKAGKRGVPSVDKEQAEFLKTSGVHTRSEGPVPAISLSTELPASVPEVLELPDPDEASDSQDEADARVLSAQDGAESSGATETSTEVSSHGEDEQISQVADLLRESRQDEEVLSSEEDQQKPGTKISEVQEELSESGSDSEDPSAGLAASMWAALQKQRLGTGSNLGTQSSKQDEAADETTEIEWRPETGLPTPLRCKDLEAQQRKEGNEAGLSKQFMAPPREAAKKQARKSEPQQRLWHDLPVTPITDDVKRDLRLLRLRGAMDPKRFYKKAEKGRFPTRFAVGTIVEGPAEFYSGRLNNKQRKQTITEELLADESLKDSRKRRVEKLEEERSKWSHRKQRGSGEHIKKRAKRPKH